MTRLLADIPRCYGIDRHPKCESCARKHQMERDDDTRWLPMVAAKPDERGRCGLYIFETEAECPPPKPQTFCASSMNGAEIAGLTTRTESWKRLTLRSR